MKTYAGVGSRETPVEVGHKMVVYAQRLAKLNYVMVSGGARKKRDAPDNVVSADHVFEHAVAQVKGKMIIYRAYVNKFIPCGDAIVRIPDEAQMAKAEKFIRKHRIISWFDKMSSWAKLLHQRNYYQIVQENGHKVDFVISYSVIGEDGEPSGGTRTAIKIAEKMGIKVYNLYRPMDEVMLEQHISELEKCNG